MSQLKISLAGVLAILSALAFGFVCFLGLNFYSLGNMNQSITVAAIIAGLLIALALGAKKLKQTTRNFKTFLVFEILLLVLLTGVFTLSTWRVFSHYFVVSEQQEVIKNKLEASISQAQNMFTTYESYADSRLSTYQGTLHSVVNNRGINPQQFADFGFVSDVNNNTQINTKMFAARADLYPSHYSNTVNNDGIKEVANKWLTNANSKVMNWKPISIVNITNNIEANSDNWLSELKGFSSTRQPQEQADDFTYSLSFSDVKTHFTTLGKPTVLSVGLAALGYLLLLLPWFITKRDSRSQGATQTEKYEIVL